MKVHLIKKQTIEDFIKKQSNSKLPFKLWLETVKSGDWNDPNDIKRTFGSADLLGNGSNRVTFNIGGNNYRLICQYSFGQKAVHLFIC